MSIEAMTLALKALERADKISGYANNKKAINALSAAIEKEQSLPEEWGVMFAIEGAIQNGNCPWEIEQAFEAYTAKLKEKNT
jgi:hypothetical protein